MRKLLLIAAALMTLSLSGCFWPWGPGGPGGGPGGGHGGGGGYHGGPDWR